MDNLLRGEASLFSRNWGNSNLVVEWALKKKKLEPDHYSLC